MHQSFFSLLFQQKIIYKQTRFGGIVRIISGPEVLPDDSTLEGQGITDGSTIYIVIKPDREISLCIKHGPKEITCSVSNSMRVGSLKQQLMDGGTVGYEPDEFSLIVSADDITKDISLHDDSQPLHMYGVNDNTTIRIVRRSVTIQLVSPDGNKYSCTFPKTTTVNEMKEKLEPITGIFSSYARFQFPMGFIYFVQTGSQYRKLQGENPIGTILEDNDVIYCIEDIFVPQKQTAPVYYNNKTEIGRVGWSRNGEPVFSLKLRVQHQLGFPASSVDVTPEGNRVDYQSHYRINVMPNVSNLEEHKITDSSIAAEHENKIRLHVKMGPKEITCSMSSSVRVRDLKQKLIDGGTVGFEPDEFSLIVSADDNAGITEDISLHDDSQPLHLYGVNDKSTIRIISRSVMIQLVNPSGEIFYQRFPKAMTANQLKEKLQPLIDFFTLNTASTSQTLLCGPLTPRIGAIFFLQTGSRYRKLQGEERIGTILEDNGVIYCIEDLISYHARMVPVYHADPSKIEFRRQRQRGARYEAKKVEIGQVGWNYDETVLTLKLRVQHQLGFPVSCVDVKLINQPKAFRFSREAYPIEVNVS